MAEREVEEILNEIKERVRAGEASSSRVSSASLERNGSQAQPERTSETSSHPAGNYHGLAILARAWDRLPPLVSNRSGVAAQVELWLKARLKRALRWITWEQVNFNAAVHQTLREVVDSLTTYGQQLRQVINETTARQEQFEQQRRLIQSLRAEVQADTAARREQLEKVQLEISTRRSEVEKSDAQIKELQAQLALVQQERLELQSRLVDLLGELRERDERLLDEQRVCFKQLSLEAGEAFVLQDRARRDLESRLLKLETERDCELRNSNPETEGE